MFNCLWEDRTARPNGHKVIVPFDAEMELWTNTLLFRGVYMRKVTVRIELAVCRVARPRVLHGWMYPNIFFYYVPPTYSSSKNGTNDHEQPRSVPFGPTRSNRVSVSAD